MATGSEYPTDRTDMKMPSMNNVSPEVLRQLYWAEGLSLEGVGARLGISHSGVDILMRRHNIPRRERAQAYQAYLRRMARKFAAELPVRATPY